MKIFMVPSTSSIPIVTKFKVTMIPNNPMENELVEFAVPQSLQIRVRKLNSQEFMQEIAVRNPYRGSSPIQVRVRVTKEDLIEVQDFVFPVSI